MQLNRVRRKVPPTNLTPLIDVVFLLLIFFMVSSTFKEELGIDIALPQAQTAASQEVTANEITVDADGRYFFGPRQVSIAGLREALQRYLEENPGASVVLRADALADFGAVVRAIDTAREVGGERLVIPTDRPGPAGLVP